MKPIKLDILMKELSLELLSGGLDREVCGVYTGDLLSWVMSHANADDCWITIMSNTNVVAVASLVDTACVILSEDVRLEEDALTAAKEKNITVFTTPLSSYEVCEKVSRLSSRS